jgi:hypothetical protein
MKSEFTLLEKDTDQGNNFIIMDLENYSYKKWNYRQNYYT